MQWSVGQSELSKKSDKEKIVEATLYRIAITILGIIVATIFLRDRKEIMKHYGELKEDSPFTAWMVSRIFFLLMIFIVVSIGSAIFLGVEIYKAN